MDKTKQEAQRRHKMHKSELVGLRGEEAFVREFAGMIHSTKRPSGDGGIDIRLLLRIDRLPREFNIDVKTSRRAINLVVEEGKVRPETIYVLAVYDDERDRADLIGWQWGNILAKAPTRNFSKKFKSHSIHWMDLRSIGELKRRILGEGQ